MAWEGKLESVMLDCDSQPLPGEKNRCSDFFDLSVLRTEDNIYVCFPEGIILDMACVTETGKEIVLGREIRPGKDFSSASLDIIFWSQDEANNCHNHYERMKRNLKKCYFMNVRDADNNSFSESFCFEITVSTGKYRSVKMI